MSNSCKRRGKERFVGLTPGMVLRSSGAFPPAQDAEACAVGMTQLDSTLVEHAAVRVGRLAKSGTHLEMRFVGEQGARYNARAGLALAFDDHPARCTHEISRVQAQDTPARRGDFGHVHALVHFRKQYQTCRVGSVNRPAMPGHQLAITLPRVLFFLAP